MARYYLFPCTVHKKELDLVLVSISLNARYDVHAQGSDNLTTYTFNTQVAKHTFCQTCGVQSFYTPRSNPDGYGVAPHCLDPGTVRSVTVEPFGGEKWEESMQAHKTIRGMSKH
ncbi:Centromere protein V [Liparis tanakae]|uniref:Centromere protein V n=1 Tax=Liparis tanakae TaxID=230148 RepID=A0A4Z2IZK4_9TELE|nr:Centromere protein V [Liparis tanakae]